MINLLAGSLLLSIFHALLPNHWLPLLAISRHEQWSLNKTTRITLLAGLAHGASTSLLGVLLGLAGGGMAARFDVFTRYASPALLIGLGLFYIYQHHTHHHFHLHGHPEKKTGTRIVAALALSMFLSPCFEIEAFFLTAGTYGMWLVLIMALLYVTVTAAGMVIWIRFASRGVQSLNWHKLEHNAGIITGAILIASGLIAFFAD